MESKKATKVLKNVKVPFYDEINHDLQVYIQKKIFPEYAKNDWGHHLAHIYYVLRRSFQFAKTCPDLNLDIVYTVAAYHDLGHHIDAKHHEEISAKMVLEDKVLPEFFSTKDLQTISEAVADHRSTLKGEPRSIYGKIVSTADRNIDIDTMLHRTYTYRLRNFGEPNLEAIITESRRHLINKYGKNGYALTKSYFPDLSYRRALHELQKLTDNPAEFRQRYVSVNHLERALNLESEYASYIQRVSPKLVTYITDHIFPEYLKNDKAHQVFHIREVIRRSFALNDTFKLSLDPDLIYVSAAYHDFNKYLDAEHHELIAAEKFLNDSFMSSYFNQTKRRSIFEAIADHRSSQAHPPRSEYGRLLSSADRNTSITQVFVRSFFVGQDRQPDARVSDFLNYTFERLKKRYTIEHSENFFYTDPEYLNFLTEIRTLLENRPEFNTRYCEVNDINSLNSRLIEEPGIDISPVVFI